MDHVNLGAAGIKVSRICLGTMADAAALSAKLFTGEDRSIDFEAQSAATWEKGTAAL